MKETIKIDIPFGKKATIKNGQVIIEDVLLPTTWEEYVENYPNVITEKHCAYYIHPLAPNDGIDRNISTKHRKTDCNTEDIAKGILALQQLLQLRDIYRQGWKPNWENIHEPKFSIVIIGDELDVVEDYVHRSILCFPTLEIARTFEDNFSKMIATALGNLCE